MVPRHPPFWKFDTVDPTSPWFTRSCMKTHEWTFAKVGATVHDNIFEVLIAGSLSYLYSWLPIALLYLHRGTSHIGSCSHCFLGADCHFANTSVEMAKFVRSAVQLRRQCFINPWIQTTLFLMIAIAATSALSCQLTVCWVDFADSTTIIFHRC